MTIKLYNTKTKSKDVFEPLDAKNVRMYVCGPTVYDRAHLGNARPVVVFDTLFRLLRHTYGADQVTYVRNFTDVDDKINAKAAETGRSIADITEETIGWYHDDMDALGALRPTQEPRATAFIPQMIAMIETLIERGHAYPDGAGHVLFAVRSYDEYGALARRSLDDMRAGARVEVADNKRDPMDFVLWKPSSGDQPGWDSPWGNGRPGWHIECSAMAYELLGESFDIHGGGIDLAFPHHENEVAQSKCSHPEGDFARFWLHNEMLQVEGKKMSKSLGNFFTVKDLLENHYDGAVIRLLLMSTHYRKHTDWTEERYLSLKSELTQWELVTYNVESSDVPIELLEALGDDLNTPQAITFLRKMKKEKKYPELLAGMEFLGIPALKVVSMFTIDEELDLRISELLEKYDDARNSKDYSLSDRLRKLLEDLGVSLSTGPDGTTHEIIWSNVGAERLADTNSSDFNRLSGLNREESKKWLLEKLGALE